MKIVKIIFLFISISCIYLSFSSDYISIGKTWKIIHVNSLIGLQKILEELVLLNNYNFSIWHEVIVPLLEINLFYLLFIISFIFFIFIKNKN